MKTKRLWENKHPYYFSGASTEDYESWDAFLAEMGDADDDYNLVVRWDWQEGKDHEVPAAKARVCICYVQQRRGTTHRADVMVTRDDEPRAREWLKAKLAYLMTNWAPLDVEPK